MKEIEKNALKMAKYLLFKHPLVDRCLSSALPTTINHNIWKRDFTGSTGLFSFSFKKKISK